jgi:hypothetical protein
MHMLPGTAFVHVGNIGFAGEASTLQEGCGSRLYNHAYTILHLIMVVCIFKGCFVSGLELQLLH